MDLVKEFPKNDPLIYCFWVFFLFQIMTYKLISSLFSSFDSSWLICLMFPVFVHIICCVFSIKFHHGFHHARPGTSQNSQLLLGGPTASWWGFLVHKNCRVCNLEWMNSLLWGFLLEVHVKVVLMIKEMYSPISCQRRFVFVDGLSFPYVPKTKSTKQLIM